METWRAFFGSYGQEARKIFSDCWKRAGKCKKTFLRKVIPPFTNYGQKRANFGTRCRTRVLKLQTPAARLLWGRSWSNFALTVLCGTTTG
jgi:hypothetical protein